MPNVLIPLAPGCEELEAVTVIDILRRADIEAVTASLEKGPVTASRNTRLLADITLDEAMDRAFDMIVLPGGLPGATHLRDDPRIRTLIQRMAEEGKYLGAVCAAPIALAAAGALDGKRATAYPGFLENLGLDSVEITGEAVTVDGRLITGRGPGTAMDFALALVEALVGESKRNEVEKALVR